MKNILMVLTSADNMPNGKPTGVWLSEFVEPYEEFINKGYRVSIASIKGGVVPIDPGSIEDTTIISDEIKSILENSVSIESISDSEYDGIFMPGGHGTMFDFPYSDTLHGLISNIYENNKPVGAVCHGPACLVGVVLSNGEFLVKGKNITSFTDSEEISVNLDKVVPFLLETKFRELGANFVANDNWSDHVEVDGNLITGQNPQSGITAALEFIKVLER